LATRFNPIYWNTACLIVNSGAIDPNNGGQTDYGKIAKAMGDILNRNIKISLVDINHSDFGFKPDAKNNQILYGMKSMLNVGDDLIKDIISHRPYVSPRDFMNKIHPNKQAMISLIKGGAFDSMMDRKLCMGWYIWETCDKKKRITLQNMASLIKYNLLPENNEQQIAARRIYEFNRYLKAICLSKDKQIYNLDNRAISFLQEMNYDELISSDLTMGVKEWDKQYQSWMDVFRDWIAADKDTILNSLNEKIFKNDWEKYAKGTISAWEMESLCFYYHEHELAHINKVKYGLSNFYSHPEEPVVSRSFIAKNGRAIKIYDLTKICGTCIAKDKSKSTVTLLTVDGVVTIKFPKEYFSLFDKQISAIQPDGTKKVMERSWFNRGNMIVVQGYRSGDNFIPKKYASSGGHQLYKIDEVLPDGEIVLRVDRYKGGVEEEEI
jgi:DNA polymerase-3 subunit alpha